MHSHRYKIHYRVSSIIYDVLYIIMMNGRGVTALLPDLQKSDTSSKHRYPRALRICAKVSSALAAFEKRMRCPLLFRAKLFDRAAPRRAQRQRSSPAHPGIEVMQFAHHSNAHPCAGSQRRGTDHRAIVGRSRSRRSLSSSSACASRSAIR